MRNNKVLLGMSGGVDSCMAAILLKESGYEVIGATLSTCLPAGEDPAIEDAKSFCQMVGIKHHVIKSRGEFKRQVMDYFAESYLHGYTPNPCIRCNKTIKWPYLLEAARKYGCRYVGTGHYVGIEWYQNRFYLKKGVDPAKDQSYFLWNLPQDVLDHALFPLGQYLKSDIMQLAVEYGLPELPQRRESNGVCFLSGNDYSQFLQRHIPSDHVALQPGLVIDHQGNHFGTHQGFAYYTLGQRKGLTPVLPAQWCVVHIDVQQNILIVGPREMLNLTEVLLFDYELTPDTLLWENQSVFIRIRGLDAVPGYVGTVEITNEGLLVQFSQPVWAITPGQSIVIYQNDLVIGGGEVPDYFQ